MAAALSLPLPIPLGIIFFLIGLSLLMIASPTVRLLFHRIRERYPGIDKRIESVERHLPAFLREALNSAPGGGKDSG